MKTKLLSCLLSSFLLSGSFGQSIYEFNYSSPANPSAGPISALMVRYPGGDGYLRVRYTEIQSNRAVLLNIPLTEAPAQKADGTRNPEALVVSGQQPQALSITQNVNYQPDRFLFQLDATGQYFEPSALVVPGKEPMAVQPFNSAPVLVNTLNSPELIRKYFVQGDPVYDTYAAAGSKAGPSLKPAYGRTLHLVMVAATSDTILGEYAKRDLAKMTYIFTVMQRGLGYRMDSTVLRDSTYSRQHVAKAIQQLKADPNDVIVFYYSGHGFNYGRKNPYPSMILMNEPYKQRARTYVKNSLALDDIYKTILAKGAKTNIVLGDCCNSDIDSVNNFSMERLFNAGKDVFDFDFNKCRELFVDRGVSVLNAATSKGEVASTGLDGSFFTSSFYGSMLDLLTRSNKKISNVNNPSWNDVGLLTQVYINKFTSSKCNSTQACKMTPIIEVKYQQ